MMNLARIVAAIALLTLSPSVWAQDEPAPPPQEEVKEDAAQPPAPPPAMESQEVAPQEAEQAVPAELPRAKLEEPPAMGIPSPTTISPNYRSPLPPPAPLAKVNDHWSPYFMPPMYEGAEVVPIQIGDTLWDLSQKHMSDGHLWPQLWEINSYITDPHWIYPGDPLYLKPINLITPEAVAKASQMAGLGAEEPAVTPIPEATTPQEPVTAPVKPEKPPIFVDVTRRGPRPAASYDEIYCSYYVTDEKPAFDIHVADLDEPEADISSAMKLVYLDAGRLTGVEPGKEFAVFRVGGAVRHPVSDRKLGKAVYRIGKLRILAVQDKTATAKMVESCREVQPGDGVAPWQEIPVPLYLERPFERIAEVGNNPNKGYVVYADDDSQLIGERSIITVDMGENQGVAPGDYLTAYGEREVGDEIQRVPIGQLIVLLTQNNSATCKVVKAFHEIDLGQRVEMP